MKKTPIKKVRPTKKVPVTKDKGQTVVREVEMEVAENREIQDGVMSNSKLGGTAQRGKATVGLSLGMTLNMGDYQSARVDVFIQREVEDTDGTIDEGLHDISDKLHEELERQASLLDAN